MQMFFFCCCVLLLAKGGNRCDLNACYNATHE